MSTASPTAPPLGNRVQDELERLITEGVLAPGERLNEVVLARRMGVSRGPVREAARALQKTGLVTVVANRGAFVRSLSIEEAAEIYDLNAVLFGFAAGQVAARGTAAPALELRELVNRMDAAAGAAEADTFFALNSLFHARIMALAANRQIEGIYLDHTRKLRLLRRLSLTAGSNMAEANAEHRGVLAAIMAGDAPLARERAEAHARAGRARFLATVEMPAPAIKRMPEVPASEGIP